MNSDPTIYQAVRAVGVLKPQFNPDVTGRVFADRLEVIGTAFWLKNHKVLVTCAHVVADLMTAPAEVKGLITVSYGQSSLRAAVSEIDYEHDLAVLKIPDVNPEIIDAEASTGLEIAESYVSVSTPVAYAGFPMGDQLLDASRAATYAEGVVSARKRQLGTRKNIQISGHVIGGYSGAPVVEKQSGQVIGVLSNSPSHEAGQAGIFMAVSWEHVEAIAKLATS